MSLAVLVVAGFGCGDDKAEGGAVAGAGPGGSGGAPAAGGTGGTGGSSGAPAGMQKLGGFAVNVNADSMNTTIAGAVKTGTTPEGTVWKLKSQDGDCQLLLPETPFCDPACGAKTCVVGNQCVASPTNVAVGPVRVQGVGADFTMMPRADGSYTPPDDVTVPFPPAADGSPIRFSADGGALGAFTLESDAISPLAITSGDMAAIESGKPLTLTWTKGASAKARVDVGLDLSHHGGTKAKIRCDAPDTGSLSIPGALLGELIGIGVSGFPVIEIGRYTSASAAVSGGVVELTVFSRTRIDVTVPGLVSCYADEECPSGQTCQPDHKCS